MIKANELRIGNKLLVDGNIWTIESISNFELYLKENDNYNHLLNAKPIPLTEEILFKAKGIHIPFYHVFDNIELGSVEYDFVDGYYSVKVEGKFIKKIKYLHQLQNLYFALKSKELEINL